MLKRTYWGAALALLAGVTGCTTTAEPVSEPAPEVAVVEPAPEPRTETAEPQDPDALSVPSVRRRSMQRIDVVVEDADLRDVMDQIGREVGRNILVDANVHERVTVSLRDIPWRDAVDVIARMTRCEIEVWPGG